MITPGIHIWSCQSGTRTALEPRTLGVHSHAPLSLQKLKRPRKLASTWLWWSGLETWSWLTMRGLITNSLRPLTNLNWRDPFNGEPGHPVWLDPFHFSFVHILCAPLYNSVVLDSPALTGQEVSEVLLAEQPPDWLLQSTCPDLLDTSHVNQIRGTRMENDSEWTITTTGEQK